MKQRKIYLEITGQKKNLSIGRGKNKNIKIIFTLKFKKKIV